MRAEWNMNRYFTPVVSNNDEADQRYFPLASMALPRRPDKGIVKLKTNEGFAQPGYMNAVPNARFYVNSDVDRYNYWSSTLTADTFVTGNGYSFATPQRPTVLYPSQVSTNKIVVGFENSLSSPKSFTIQVSTNGTTWSTVATNPTINSKGKVELYLQAGGTWSTNPFYSNITKIRGIRVVVTTMTEPFSRLAVIEISPRIHNDVTPFTVQWDSSFEASDVSDLMPIGKSSANTGSVTLSNTDLRFNNDNSTSLYYGLMDKNVKFTVDFGLKLSTGAYEYVRQLTMYTEKFAPSSDNTVVAQLKDTSIYLQEETIPAMYLENHTIGAIIWKIMDILGYTNYFYNVKQDDSQIVPYFWTSGEKTAWDEIGGLAETTQTAVYFDENDVMRINTKNNAFDSTRAVDWNFRATTAVGLVANIEELEQDRVFESNKLNVIYKETKFSDFNNGFPKMEVSWEPEDTVVLRSSSITKPIIGTPDFFEMDQAKSVTWPYIGIVNIQGEMIKYSGKYYRYYDLAGNVQVVVVSSVDEKNVIDKEKSNEFLAWKNQFTGSFKISERGAYGTKKSDHTIYTFVPNAPGPRYVGAYINFNNFSGINFYPRASYQNNDGVLNLKTDSSYSWIDMHLVHNGYTQDLVPYGNFGTRIKFKGDGYPDNMGVGGMYFCGGSGGQGFYLGAGLSSAANASGVKAWPEIVLYVKGKDGGSLYLVGNNAQISKEVWYDLEARVDVINPGAAGQHYRVSIYLNGAHMATAGVDINHFENLGRSGAWIRSHCSADFEYLYAFEDGVEGLDDPANRDELGGSSMDLIYGGFKSNTVYSRVKYNWIWSAWDKKYRHVGNFFFDDFTPVVHEVREFRSEFKENPVLHSYPYLTNDYQAMILEYESDPFGSSMLVANASRTDAVLNGEDNSLGPDDTINQKMMVYGRLLNQEDEQNVVVTNDEAIRKRGVVETKVESMWTQTKSMAESLATWTVKTFGKSADELTITAFAHPIIQVGDLITVNHPAFNMTDATHQYFVTSVNRQWSDGLSTTISCKRYNP